MDQMIALLETPSWAYDFCYFFVFVAAIVVVNAVYSMVNIFRLPEVIKKMLPITSIILSLVLSAMVAVVMTMMQFWICRGALQPSKQVERFAANCQTAEDCTAIMGTPQPSYSECGARKKCGGYNMQNNMESNGDLTGLSGF
jgi:hypothetical protein